MEKRRFPFDLADLVGKSLTGQLSPACERIELAGSIRRRRQDVGDIEILCIPKVAGLDLFGQPVEGDNELDRLCLELLDKGTFQFRLNSSGVKMYGPLNKYVVHAATGIPVDVFSTTPEQWGMAMVVRTGPADFCRAIMSRFQQLGLQGHAYGGVSTAGGQLIECPTEEKVFELLQWDFLPPKIRGSTPDLRWAQIKHVVQERSGR